MAVIAMAEFSLLQNQQMALNVLIILLFEVEQNWIVTK
jgi:hypothetical protein